jgi:predicted RNA-binding protein associated with RNAse of E/G family
MTHSETVRFEIWHYRSGIEAFENELVALLPGLLITQFSTPKSNNWLPGVTGVGLRFDFIEDWYSVLAYLDDNKRPTGFYHIFIQSPLENHKGIWRGTALELNIAVYPDGSYVVNGEEEFCAAVEDGWLRVYAAAKARETLRNLCLMLDEGRLPQEVMDAVSG